MSPKVASYMGLLTQFVQAERESAWEEDLGTILDIIWRNMTKGEIDETEAESKKLKESNGISGGILRKGDQ